MWFGAVGMVKYGMACAYNITYKGMYLHKYVFMMTYGTRKTMVEHVFLQSLCTCKMLMYVHFIQHSDEWMIVQYMHMNVHEYNHSALYIQLPMCLCAPYSTSMCMIARPCSLHRQDSLTAKTWPKPWLARSLRSWTMLGFNSSTVAVASGQTSWFGQPYCLNGNSCVRGDVNLSMYCMHLYSFVDCFLLQSFIDVCACRYLQNTLW